MDPRTETGASRKEGPDRAEVVLRPVTVENWREVAGLRVAPGQEEWVAPNAYSLAEAAYGLGPELAEIRLAPLAVYASIEGRERPVGFAMVNHGPDEERFFIMRLMIDASFQGRRFGGAALDAILADLLSRPQAKEVGISVRRENVRARDLYLSRGFTVVPSEDSDEILLWRALHPQDEPWESLWNPAATPGS